jgi:hypothetical protein
MQPNIQPISLPIASGAASSPAFLHQHLTTSFMSPELGLANASKTFASLLTTERVNSSQNMFLAMR